MERSNEKALKIVEQQYNSFINLQDKWDFFRGLAGYIKTIQEMALTKPLIEAFEKQREVAQKTYNLMNTGAMQELKKSAEKMTEIAKSVTRQYEPMLETINKVAEAKNLALKTVEVYQNNFEHINDAVKNLSDHLEGRIFSSHPLSALDRGLFEIAKQIKASGYPEAIKEFEDNQKKMKNIYGDYTFSPIYEKLSDEESKLERKKQVEPWGAWERLPIVERLVFEPEETIEEFKNEAETNPSFKWTLINFFGVAGEMEKIRSGEGVSDNDIVFFRVKDFKSFSQRVHTHITTELIKTDTESLALDFDDTNRTLSFMNEVIIIAKKEESDPHKLMRTLFKDTHKIWANDEVLEDWGYSYEEKISTNKVYQAGKKVNIIIAQDTKIKDFLDVSTKSVSINKKYLKQ